MISKFHQLAFAALSIAASTAALAQAPTAYPCETVKFIVPYPPGGSSDILARMLSSGLASRLGTTIVVENKAGAAGNIGTGQAATARGDGCTWLLGNATNVVITRNLYKLSPDPMAALQPVAEVAAVPMVLYANSTLPVKDMQQFVDFLKANPGKHSFASPGSGTPHHMLGEQLNQNLGLSTLHVPYKGSGPAIQDVMAGHVSFAFDGTSSIIPHIAGGRVRVLATTGDKRSAGLPDVPTMKELGHSNFVVTNWYGVFVPRDTPADLVNQLNASIREEMKSAQFKEALLKMDSQNADYSAEQYEQFVKKDAPYWESLVKQTGAKVD